MPKLLSPRKFFPFSGPPHTFLILSSVKCSLQKFLVIVEERLKIKEAIIYRLPAIPSFNINTIKIPSGPCPLFIQYPKNHPREHCI